MEFPWVLKKEHVEIPVESDKPKNSRGFFQNKYDLNSSILDFFWKVAKVRQKSLLSVFFVVH